MQLEMHYGNTITRKPWTPPCLTVNSEYEWICISFCIAQNHIGESYKIISSQAELSLYQILCSHCYLYTILNTLFRLVSDTNILPTTKAKH